MRIAEERTNDVIKEYCGQFADHLIDFFYLVNNQRKFTNDVYILGRQLNYELVRELEEILKEFPATEGKEVQLFAIFAAIKYFRSQLEGRTFSVYTDHKSLIHAFKKVSDTNCSPQLRQLDFISQFTVDIRYIEGPENVVADFMSRIETIGVLTAISSLRRCSKVEHQ